MWAPLAIRLDAHNSFILSVLGRLRPGVERSQAATELAAIMTAIPKHRRDWNRPVAASITPLQETITGKVATSLLTILGAVRFAPATTPMLVGLYITGAYWFTASTSFANPAVTVARMLSDSFAGIAPSSVPGFIIAQLGATVIAWRTLPWLFAKPA